MNAFGLLAIQIAYLKFDYEFEFLRYRFHVFS